ncbi:MAG: hypothetical protein CO132_00115 [Candidatus Kerfeldbacteria bacterium CG_4_9_14_3_um_filter_45_8]|nr:MAG: hypothetical protein CO132_00115 [Candidatus Kerfeldbacteria bacterium CG_4_9_14_3_um_filter_45_8]
MRKAKHKQEQHIHAEGHSHQPLIFPDNFLWGTSTSAHQVEGGNKKNDWWAWEQKVGHIKTGETSGRATDHYHRFSDDFKLAKTLNQNAHRLSIEWSRIEPNEGEWDWDEVEHYREVLRCLKEDGIEVMVTLHHFTNPQWLAEKGGWLNRDTPQQFARYAEFIAEHLGEYVDLWCTINEPVIYGVMSYATGEWPPQEKNNWKMLKVIRAMAKAHRLAYGEIKAEMHKQRRKAHVGIAKNMIDISSYNHRVIDYIYVRLSEYFWNELFYRWTKRSHDFLGVNYYFHQRVRRKRGGGFIFVDVRKEEGRESSDLGWEVFAPGLFEILMNLKKYKLPIYITENGIATVNDDKRSRFIVAHTKEIYHAIQAGAKVKGYFHWSLLDNFEWDKGFEPRFGLVAINYGTLKRTIRDSAYVYARIAKENAISHDLLRFIGHGAPKEHQEQ